MKKTILRILGIRGRITIPFIYRKVLGIEYDDLLSFTLSDNCIILKKEKVCDNCQNRKPDVLELKDLINALSTDEQYEALTLLTAKLSKGRNGG